MSFRYNDILQIPERSLIQQRLTKAFFLRIIGLSSAERKLLNNTIEQMEILAQLIPEKSNVPSLVNDTESYEQVLVIVCTVTDGTLDQVGEKCILFIQKYIAHQVLLILEDATGYRVNVTEKRINQKDNSKLTMERSFTTNVLSKLYKNELSDALYKAMNFSSLNKTNLQLLYKGYIQAVVQYQAATITGSYIKRTNARTAEDMKHLEAIGLLESTINSLSSQMKKESQLNEQVQLNIKIKEKRTEISKLKTILSQ